MQNNIEIVFLNEFNWIMQLVIWKNEITKYVLFEYNKL